MKFLRRASNWACIVSLLTWLSACVFAQARPEAPPVPENQAAEDQGAVTSQSLDAIAAELRAMRDAAREQAHRADRLRWWGDTIPSWLTAVVTAAGVIAAWVTLYFLWQQVNAARADLLATHRPKVRVSNVVVTNVDHYTVVAGLNGHAWATNVGYLPATLVRTYTTWFFGSLPMPNPAREDSVDVDQNGVGMEEILSSGQTLRVPLRQEPLTFPQFRQLRDGSVFLVGVVKYWDEGRKTLRRTFFCRRYNGETGRFEKVDDPDYEYEE